MAPIPTPRLPLWLRALHSSARYAATASVRGLLVAGIQVFVPYRIHPSIHPWVSAWAHSRLRAFYIFH